LAGRGAIGGAMLGPAGFSWGGGGGGRRMGGNLGAGRSPFAVDRGGGGEGRREPGAQRGRRRPPDTSCSAHGEAHPAQPGPWWGRCFFIFPDRPSPWNFGMVYIWTAGMLYKNHSIYIEKI
jgi:hypothetical protein